MKTTISIISEILAWSGVFFMALAAIFAASGAYFIAPIFWGAAIVGLSLMLIFGLGRFILFREKSHYFWLVLIILGLLYGLSHFLLWVRWPEEIRKNGWSSIYMEFGFSWGLSLVAIISGLILKLFSARIKSSVSEKPAIDADKEALQ